MRWDRDRLRSKLRGLWSRWCWTWRRSLGESRWCDGWSWRFRLLLVHAGKPYNRLNRLCRGSKLRSRPGRRRQGRNGRFDRRTLLCLRSRGSGHLGQHGRFRLGFLLGSVPFGGLLPLVSFPCLPRFFLSRFPFLSRHFLLRLPFRFLLRLPLSFLLLLFQFGFLLYPRLLLSFYINLQVKRIIQRKLFRERNPTFPLPRLFLHPSPLLLFLLHPLLFLGLPVSFTL